VKEIRKRLEPPAGIRATPSGLAVVGVGLLDNLEANRILLTYLAITFVFLFLCIRLRSIIRSVVTSEGHGPAPSTSAGAAVASAADSRLKRATESHWLSMIRSARWRSRSTTVSSTLVGATTTSSAAIDPPAARTCPRGGPVAEIDHEPPASRTPAARRLSR
jgi:hypothetical protein